MDNFQSLVLCMYAEIFPNIFDYVFPGARYSACKIAGTYEFQDCRVVHTFLKVGTYKLLLFLRLTL